MTRLLAAIFAVEMVINYHDGYVGWAALDAAMLVWCAVGAARKVT